MAHNKNARAAAQILVKHRCQPRPVINATTAAGASTTMSASNTTRTRRELSHGQPRTPLWNPGAGIRFAPEREAQLLYPTLDFKRFFQSQDVAASAGMSETLTMKPLPPIPPLESPSEALSEVQQNLQSRLQSIAEKKPILNAKRAGTYTANTRPPKRSAQPTTPTLQPPPSTIDPPITSLDFNISPDLFHAALAQPKDSLGSFWSHTLYERTTTTPSSSSSGTAATQNVKVHYCTTKHTMEHVCQKYFLHEPVLGFDLEWVAYAKRDGSARDNVSLIQVASPSRIGLFHIALFPKDDFVAPTFRAIMGDVGVLKVGVHVQADCTRMRKFLGVETRGIFELSHLYKLVKHAEDGQRRKLINKVPVALATQVQEVLKLPLFKGQDVRSSNWSKPLDSKQLTYSAADAYAGLQLYHVLEERRLAMNPPPDRPRHAELGLPIPIPPTPVVSDVESDAAESSSDDSGSEFSDDSIEEVMQELAANMNSSAAPRRPTLPMPTKQAVARDARIEVAEAKVTQRRSRHRLLASPSALRTFYIWQANDDLSPADVAKLLRDPPLQTGTVIGYILDAILAEKLVFPKDRLQKEVLSLLHPTLANGKYRSIVKQCE